MAERRWGPAEKGPGPTQQQIVDLRSELRPRYAARNARIETWREMRRDEFEIEIPTTYKTTASVVKLGLPRIYIRRAVQAITANGFRVKAMPPPQALDEDFQASDARERFATAFWEQLERQQSTALFNHLVDHQVADGQGWLKLVYRPDIWHDIPELVEEAHADAEETSPQIQRDYVDRVAAWKRGAPAPFAIRLPDPATILPVRGEFGLDAVLEISKRPLLNVLRWLGRWGGEPLDDSDQAHLQVEVVEYWDARWQVILVGQDGGWMEAHRFEHGYGFIPYFHAPGWEEPTTDPAEQCLSVLTPLEGQVEWIYKMLTAKGNRVWLTSFPSWQSDSTLATETTGGQPRPYELETGKVHPVEPEAKRGIWAIEPPRMSDDIEQLFSVLAMTAESSQMDVAGAGGGSRSGESGYYRSLVSQMARIPFDQIGRNAGRAMSQLLARAFWLIEHRVGDSVTVRYSDEQTQEWVSIDPVELQGNYDIEVVVEAEDPVSRIAKERHYMLLWQGKFLPKRRALEQAGEEQPEDLIDEQAWEEYMDTPQMKAQMWEYMSARRGRPQRPQLLGPDGQPIPPGMYGEMGGEAPGTPQAPGRGAPLAAPANQPGPQQAQVA